MGREAVQVPVARRSDVVRPRVPMPLGSRYLPISTGGDDAWVIRRYPVPILQIVERKTRAASDVLCGRRRLTFACLRVENFASPLADTAATC
jgi:hypothetical protein